MMRRQRGFTLIELVIFLGLVSLLVAGVFGPLTNVLRFAPKNLQQTQALALAKTRLELMLNQYYSQGFDAVTQASTTCRAPIDCDPTGYTVTTKVSSGWTGDPSNTNFKTLRVVVTGNGDATLTTLVAR